MRFCDREAPKRAEAGSNCSLIMRIPVRIWELEMVSKAKAGSRSAHAKMALFRPPHMKLATLRNDTRDGALAVVSRDLQHALIVFDLAPTLQAALDDWTYIAPQLEDRYQELNRQPGGRAFAFDSAQCMAPLPRAYQWLDASAYLPHVELLRKARGVDMPADARRDPLMYQGNSAWLTGPRDPVQAASEDWGIDIEAEVAVILGDVEPGTRHEQIGRAHV